LSEGPKNEDLRNNSFDSMEIPEETDYKILEPSKPPLFHVNDVPLRKARSVAGSWHI
jgi:hypothetical protein